MDLIDRQAAIDAVKSRKTAEQSSAGIMRNAVVDFCVDIIKKLPSAQPQPVVRCKDCKWCEDADGSMCKNPASWVVATDSDFGCVLAERRGRRRASDDRNSH